MKKLTSLLSATALIITVIFNSCNKDESLAVLITSKASDVTLTSAKTGGYISNDGGTSVTSRGVCWGTNNKPTSEDNKTTDGTGKGNFVSELTGLTPGTTYYVRAYAVNKEGTSYGNQETFKTSIEVPTLSTASAADITLTTAMTGGNITSNGGDSITARGVCWGKTENPTISNSFTTDGTGSGSFVSHLNGLSAGTTYYVRAYATNSAGTGYGNQVFFSTSPVVKSSVITADVTAITAYTAVSGGSVSNDGGGAITARGICWSTAENPTTANFVTTNGTGAGSFVSNMTGLTAGTTYYVRAYATNVAGTGYGSTITFKTSAIIIPTLTTSPATGVTPTAAVSGGNVTSDGGSPVTARGICWNTTGNPTTGDKKTSEGTGTGAFSSDISGLTPGTVYYVRAYATNIAGTSYGNVVSFTTTAVVLPSLTTMPITDITSITAISGGNISSDGGSALIARGICWNLTGNPTIADKKTTDGIGTGTYSSDLSELTPGTLYYVRAYATNALGTTYGNQVTFTSLVALPTITTSAASSITFNSAVSGGTISNSGGAAITMKGICWSTNEDPTTANSKTENGPGTSAFTATMTGLLPVTTYYVRSYSVNSAGTSYGNQVSFTTAPALPAVTTADVTAVTINSSKSGGNISVDGGAPVTSRGVCWSTTENPTTSNGKTEDGSGTGSFISEPKELLPGTTYYLRAYATNSAGTAYGNQVTFTTLVALPSIITTGPTAITTTTASSGGNITNAGGGSITMRGVCWSASENPSLTDSKTEDGSGIGAFASHLTGLTPGSTYYIRAYATNSAGTAYGNQVSFVASVALPVLTTADATNITTTGAKSGGNISSTGGAPVTVRGLAWSTTENPTTANSKTENGTGSGAFAGELTGLAPGTIYYIRAYATNSAGTAYGNQVTFTTLVALPSLITTEPTAITTTTASSGGNITNAGGGSITMRGVCWSASENPSLTDSKTEDGSGIGTFASNLTGLTPGSTYYIRAYATNSAGTAYGNQVSFVASAALPVLTTANATNITTTGAKSGGNISSTGGAPVTVRGLAWSTTENPTTANSKTENGTGSGAFAGELTGLTPGTIYYIRAYATNSAGTAYGNQVTFTTLVALPVLTTSDISGVTLTTAISGGNITDAGGGTITLRGICWSTAVNPTVSNSKTENGTGTGVFSGNLTGLTPGTTYYVRAYATNSAGTAYGNQRSFTTNPVGGATLTTSAITGLTSITAISGGNITDNGGGLITARGICWSTLPTPTITDPKTTNGTGNGTFVSNITGLTNGTTYYVRAYATNSSGTTYGNEISFITPVTDIQGNVYKTVKIGPQVWMAENLKATKFNDNADIVNVTVDSLWSKLATPAYCVFANAPANRNIYGALYNWFALNTKKLCPTGWHVPSDPEYNALEISLGMPAADSDLWGWRGVDGGLKIKSTTGWTGTGNGTNTSGLNVLPGGYRQYVHGDYWGLGTTTYFWSATDDSENLNPTVAWYRRVDGDNNGIYKATTSKSGGKYVRCVKD